jgi:hypothetical protein
LVRVEQAVRHKQQQTPLVILELLAALLLLELMLFLMEAVLVKEDGLVEQLQAVEAVEAAIAQGQMAQVAAQQAAYLEGLVFLVKVLLVMLTT